MSNFLLRDPDCVLIHIPKTGGSSIRHGLWASRYEGPVFGEMPDDWRGYFKFAFVRHPLDRLVSAWADFSQMRNFRNSIDSFLDIVVDETVIYDERRKTLAERIRHHTIAQTHPFNCLSHADYVGRYETYLDDLRMILDRVGMPQVSVPHLRKTDHGGWKAHLNGKTLDRAVAYFDQDFELLGYKRP
ncbi:MAG: sulfotransferase family 2 domain-containing protein [Oceanicaulis sp.]|nr:sulfotransferase family 2 domain-containing protein [Oceanicaulis sp.]